MIRLTGWLAIVCCFIAMYMASLIGYPYMVGITMIFSLITVGVYIAAEIETYRGEYDE